MSAIRTNRADGRNGRLLAPYTSWFSRMFGIQSPEESEEQVKSSTSTEKDSTSASTLSTSQTLTSEHQTSNTELNRNHRPHLTPARYRNTPNTASSSASPPDIEMDNVASFLTQSAGQSVSAKEVEGMLAILRGNTPPEPREIFRFSSSTPTRDLQSSPSTPLSARKKLPRNPNGVYRWEGAGSAKHVRPRNRYTSPAFGASPSKQDRLAMKESIDSQDTSLPDSKRRRVGDELSSSSISTQRPSVSEPATRKVPFPSTTSPTPGTNGVASRSNPHPSPSRLRTPVKPTAPVIPSPLRQTWSETSSTSQNETRKSPSQTKTANFMAELIKETTPPKKPDLTNPYQVASPVGKVGPPRRSTKRPRATGRPVAPTKAEIEVEKRKKEETKEKEKLKEYSPQAIIEATVPKGSQRSRPPAHFEKSMETSIIEEDSSHAGPRPQREAPVVVETRKITYVVEEVSDIDDDDAEAARRSAKRAKPSINGRGPAPSAPKRIHIVVPEPEITVEDIDMDATEQKEKTKEQPKLIIPTNENGSPTYNPSTSPTNAISPTASRSKLSSAPKEPSKLRFSFQPEGTPVPSSPKITALPAPSPPGLQKSEFKFEPPSSNFSFTFKPTDLSPGGSIKPQEQAKKAKVKDASDEGIKAKARTMTASSLPTFVMTSSATSVLPSSADLTALHRRVKGLPVSSLPSFELSSGPSKSGTPFSFNPSTSKPPAITPFGFAAAGMNPPSNNPGTWICSLCSLSNPSSALKCQICDHPATSTSSSGGAAAPAAPAPPPAPPAVPAIKAFDFGAAGMKAPSVPPGTWICSLCALTNPMSANQCETCETARTFYS
ncbi:hypothetical protein BYT27DRAFT_7199016 [Phlegmacium glaucopus]|nr:hypothetical protein BYT27DRAFT_7199016 [Phlegmacium glaucopus]